MEKLINSIQEAERWFNKAAEKMVFHHPLLGEVVIFIEIPILILIAVTVCTAAITFPLALILGWL